MNNKEVLKNLKSRYSDQLLEKTEYDSFKQRYTKEIRNLRKLFLSTPFSSTSFDFLPTKNDWKIIRNYVPSICLYITNRCNARCKVCFTESSTYDLSGEMSLEDIKKILKMIGRGKRITLIGGEPTVRKDLFEIIDLIRKAGSQAELYTNGLKLSDLDYVMKLKKYGISRVYLSFDGFNENVYKKMQGYGKEILMMKLLAIKNLNKAKINTILSTRVLKGLNEDEVKKLIDFCVYSAKRNGCVRGVYFFAAIPYGRFLLPNCEMSSSELANLIEKATRRKVKLEYFIETKKLLLHLFKLGLKVKLSLPIVGGGGLFGIYKAGSIKEMIPLESLKRINMFFDKDYIRKAIFEILKIGELREIALKFLVKKDVFKTFTGKGRFVIGIGTVNTPINYKSFLNDVIGIKKIKPNIVYSAGSYTAKTETS